MKGINHLVLAAGSLDAIRQLYRELGFTVTPAGQHPFGTGNSIIQLHGSYLELLAVTRPQAVVEPGPGEFSFSAFNRDYLRRHEGFSMMVMDTPDAAADIANWKAAGLVTYAPFEFARQAKMPDGEDVTVGFSLAFVSNPIAPWLGLFACQHFRPQYYAQPHYQKHANSAHHLHDVWVSGPGALELEGYLTTVIGSPHVVRGQGRIDINTNFGTVVLAERETFRQAFGVMPPHPEDGPHLCGLTIACESGGHLKQDLLSQVGVRQVVNLQRTFGTALAFVVQPSSGTVR